MKVVEAAAILYLWSIFFAGVFVYTALNGYANIVPSLAAVAFAFCFLLPTFGLAEREDPL